MGTMYSGAKTAIPAQATLKDTIESAFRDEWVQRHFDSPYKENDEYRDALFAAISHGVLKYLSANAVQIRTDSYTDSGGGTATHHHDLLPFTVEKSLRHE